MVNKIIACADIHFRNLAGLTELQSVLETFIEKCKKLIAKEESPDNVRIVVCGDLVESKISISNECTLALGWFLRELNKLCPTIVIGGNHDAILSNLQRVDSITPLFQIGDYDRVKYLDAELGYESGCYVDDNIVWCLYSMFDNYSRPDIEQMRNDNPDKTFVGLIHADINGATDFNGRATENGLNLSIFSGLDFAIAGHIHKHQELKKDGVKIVYCSSIRQKDFGETVTGHGFVLWDVAKKSYKFVNVENPDQGYYKFEINSIKDIEGDKEELMNL